MNKTIATAAAATTLVGLGITMPPAVANDADVIRRGSCSGSSDWKLKASPEDGRIEVEGEVDSNKVGQTWRWRILHNGDVSARGTKATKGPSGSFEVRRVLVNLRGDDVIGWRARNPKTDEVCRGRLVF
ncbi:MAG: hypothetical protein ACRDO2_06715 [Nocardioidaceae bacterium]